MIAGKYMLKGLLAIVVMAFAACENDPAEIEVYTKESKEVEVGKGIEAVFSQSGIMKAILKAPVMYRVKADTVYTEFPEKIHVIFYNEKTGQIDNEVKANYARYYEMLNKVYLRDSVVVFSLLGDTIYAQDMWWDQNQEIFYSDKKVRVIRGFDRLNGDGIRATQDFKKTIITNPTGPVAIPQEISQ